MTDGGAEVRSAHLPVMFEQVMEGLRVVEDGTYLDGTFGRGGHARGVLQRLGAGGRLLLMDKDPEAIAVAEREFRGDARVAIRRGSFADMGGWDAVALVSYPSRQAFIDMVSQPDYEKAHEHRESGLADTVLIAMTPASQEG